MGADGDWKDAQAGSWYVATMDSRNRVFLHTANSSWQRVTWEATAPPGVTKWIAMSAGISRLMLKGDDEQLYELGEIYGIACGCPIEPQKVTNPPGVTNWGSFVSGALHFLAIGGDGQLYAWGRNWEGQLGTGGGTADQPKPARVKPPPGVTLWTMVAAGQAHSLAMGNDCSVYAWGDDSSGQLGSASSPQQRQPIRVPNLNAPCGVPAIFTDGSASPSPDGSFKLRFNSDLNRTYLIQYSDDARSWRTAFPPVTGLGGLMDWVDDGPPTTDGLPANQPVRFYRVIFAP